MTGKRLRRLRLDEEFHFLAERHAEAAVAAMVLKQVRARVITPETTEYVKQYVSYILSSYGKKFSDLSAKEQAAMVDYHFDIRSWTEPAPETLSAVRFIYWEKLALYI